MYTDCLGLFQHVTIMAILNTHNTASGTEALVVESAKKSFGDVDVLKGIDLKDFSGRASGVDGPEWQWQVHSPKLYMWD